MSCWNHLHTDSSLIIVFQSKKLRNTKETINSYVRISKVVNVYLLCSKQSSSFKDCSYISVILDTFKMVQDFVYYYYLVRCSC